MITLNQLIYDLRNILRGGALVSDDDPISDRQLEFWINNTRATLIRQQLDKGQTLSDNITQTIDCFDVELDDTSLNTNLPSGCYIVKSKNPIPTPIEVSDRDLLLKVSAPEIGSIPYSLYPEAAMPYSDYNPFGKRVIKAYLRQGYIIIKNVPSNLTKVSISLVAADPTEVGKYNSCSGTPCFTRDSRYPINAHMVEVMKRMIIDTNFKSLQVPISDNVNNAAFDPQQPNNSK